MSSSLEDLLVAADQRFQPLPILDELDVSGAPDPRVHILLLNVKADIAPRHNLGADALHKVCGHLNLRLRRIPVLRTRWDLDAS